MEELKIYPLSADRTKTASASICENYIKGATPYNHTVCRGDSLILEPCGAYRIFVLMDGEVTFVTDNREYQWKERVTFVPTPNASLEIHAGTDAQLLEICWEIHPGDDALLEEYKTVFPYQMSYALSKQYRDRNKSDKTISRVMLEQRIIPRFAMGSVESYGPDFVKSHDHPMLDQFFVSFPENDMFLLVDYEPYRMQGNEICHIPLGANHGVDVTEKKHMHYMWIDFLIDDSSMARLDTSHIDTGVMRDFTDEDKGLK